MNRTILTILFGFSFFGMSIVNAQGAFLNKITKQENGDIEIRLTINVHSRGKQEIKMIDNDGLATLAALQFVMISPSSERLWNAGKDRNKEWDNLKSKEVPEWQILRPAVKSGIEKLIAYYNDQIPKLRDLKRDRYADDFVDRVDQLKEVTKALNVNDDVAITYDQLNPLGAFIEKYGNAHAYEMKIKNLSRPETPEMDRQNTLISGSVDNAVGLLFGSKPMVLPPRSMSKGARYILESTQKLEQLVEDFGDKKKEPKKQAAVYPLKLLDSVLGKHHETCDL